MKLTKFSDYSLRLLLYLAVNRERLVSVAEVSRAYRVSPHNVVKVVQLLVEKGLIASVRGRQGGLRLNRLPAEINVGTLVRSTEPTLDLAVCFDPGDHTCPIEPACDLKGALEEAQRAFFDTLDKYTLADFMPRAPALLRLLHRSLERG